MGLFSRKKTSGSTTSGGSRKNSSSLADIGSMSSQSSLKSPVTPHTPGFSKMTMNIPPTIPKTTLPKAPDPHVDPAGYLRSIGAVRERSLPVLEKAKANQLNHFDVDMSKFEDTTRFVVSIIKVCIPAALHKYAMLITAVQRDFDPDYASIPPHGRWQHFNAGGRDRIAELLSSWPQEIDPSERCRRLIDLFLVSVLLDAGAGTVWSYKSKQNGRTYKRSEGLAIASFEMFKDGLFSSNKQQRHQVDAAGLRELTVEKMAAGLQVTEQNPMAGLEGRASLLIRLADALNNDTLFGSEARPGNMLGKIPPSLS